MLFEKNINIIQNIDISFQNNNIFIDVLRWDLIHPLISGNKFFKLKHYFDDYYLANKAGIATYGGGYSNHILATASYAHLLNIPSVGFIRGDYTNFPTPTITNAQQLGMTIQYLTKNSYNEMKHQTQILFHNQPYYSIPEGGKGKLGTLGISDFFNTHPQFQSYNYIICSVGTGTTIAGIRNAQWKNNPDIIGIVCLKNYTNIQFDIQHLLHNTDDKITFIHDYHFGGFAKKTHELVKFITYANDVYQLPLDIVYSAKSFYATIDLIKQQYFIKNSKILFIHCGGLQGNCSINN